MQVTVRTYRHWKNAAPATRTVPDAQIFHVLHGLKDTPESLYGHRKRVARLRRHGHAVAHCTIDRSMRLAGMNVYLQASDETSHHNPRPRRPYPGPAEPECHRPGSQPGLGSGFHVYAHDVWLGICRLHRPCAFPAHRGLACPDLPGDGTGAHPAASGAVGTRLDPASGRGRGTDSTIDAEKYSTGAPLPQSSRTSYAYSNNPVLPRPIELAPYTAVKFTGNLALQVIDPSIGSMGDTYDDVLMESIAMSSSRRCRGWRGITTGCTPPWAWSRLRSMRRPTGLARYTHRVT